MERQDLHTQLERKIRESESEQCMFDFSIAENVGGKLSS
jgi:hypothetical protein